MALITPMTFFLGGGGGVWGGGALKGQKRPIVEATNWRQRSSD